MERKNIYCKDNNKEFPYISAITNGTLLDDDMVRLIHKHFNGITFSLDGTKILHNANRVYRDGMGTFDDVVLAIKRLNEINADKKITTACEVTVTDAYFENYSKDLVMNIWKLFKTLKFDTVGFIIVMDDNATLVKKESNLDMLAKELVDLWYEDLLIEQSVIMVPSLFSYLALLVGRKTNEHMRCGAGISYFAADSNYNIYPCQVSIYKDSNIIGEAKNYKLRFKEDKDIVYSDKNEHELCKQCECLRGCTSFCKIIMNDVSDEEPCSCLFNKKIFKYSLLKIAELMNGNQKDLFVQGVRKMISKEISNER